MSQEVYSFQRKRLLASQSQDENLVKNDDDDDDESSIGEDMDIDEEVKMSLFFVFWGISTEIFFPESV